MRKIKVVMIKLYFDINGVISQVMNYATNLDKDRFQVFIAAGEPYDIDYEKMCQENNIELCKLPQKQKNAYAYYRTIYSYLKKVKADNVQVHGSSAIMSAELLAAWLAGCKVRISHSHNATCENQKADKVLRPLFNRSYTTAFACGQDAGRWMFEKVSLRLFQIDEI